MITTEQVTSWRDPLGFVWRNDGRVFRAVVPEAADMLKSLLDEPWFQALMTTGMVPHTWWLSPEDGAPNHPQADKFVWLEHRALNFPVYPHEITALQLFDAATLTINLAREALSHGWVLKDASAWNVLFDNGKPVFCDILSFERPRLGFASGIWIAYAQYCRHFVIPLLLYKRLGLQPSGQFLTYRDGVTPERARQMLKGLSAWTQPALEMIVLPHLWAKKGRAAIASAAQHGTTRVTTPELADFLLKRTFNRLERHLESVKPALKDNNTVWAAYVATRDHYTDSDLEAKRSFVQQALIDSPGETVLDLGANAGEFSLLAATLGKQVTAADFDDGALTTLYEKLRTNAANVSPVLLDIARPTPALGWLNLEIPSFLARAKGKFACVMALGLIHHLLISERVPLHLVLQLMLAFESKVLIIEWVESNDPRVVDLLGLNETDHQRVSTEEFEAAFAKHYRLIRKTQLPLRTTRTLYYWSAESIEINRTKSCR